MMTTSPKDRRPQPLAATTNPGLGAARRAVISAIVGEDVEAFAQARRAAQRGLVHALEHAETIAEIRRLHCAFALDAARVYAANAARFDAFVDELDGKSAEQEA